MCLCQIIIEKSPTAVAPGQRHFNMRGSPVKGRDVWDVKKLLEVTSVVGHRRCSHGGRCGAAATCL